MMINTLITMYYWLFPFLNSSIVDQSPFVILLLTVFAVVCPWSKAVYALPNLISTKLMEFFDTMQEDFDELMLSTFFPCPRTVLSRCVNDKIIASRDRQNPSTEKCLGLIITTSGIRMDTENFSAVMDWNTPRCVKDIQAFLGFANF